MPGLCRVGRFLIILGKKLPFESFGPLTHQPDLEPLDTRYDILNRDFLDLLELLLEEEVEFMIVGAHALAVHATPRATGDLDVWVRCHPENARRAWVALLKFGAPVEALGLREADLRHRGTVFQLGVPPRRIDILTQISGVEFDQAWPSRVVKQLEDLRLPFLGRDDFVDNKRASGRAKDLADLAILEEASHRSG